MGCIYTALSKVGSREAFRVDGSRWASCPGALNPMFTMCLDAAEFDATCRSKNYLTVLSGEPHSCSSDLPTTSFVMNTKIFEELRDKLDRLTKLLGESSNSTASRLSAQVETSMRTTLLYNHFAAVQAVRIQTGRQSINPVVNCMTRPSLCVDDINLMWTIYQVISNRSSIIEDG